MSERLAFGYGADRPLPATPLRPASVERQSFDVGAALPHQVTPAEPVMPAELEEPGEKPGRDWAYVLLLVFTALLYVRPQDEFRPLALIPFAELTALSALGAMVFSRMSRGLSVSKVTPELIGVLGLGAIMLLTAPFSIWPGGAVQTFTNLFVKVLLIFILIINTLSSPARIRQFTWLLVITTSYIAFRSVFDYARGFNLIENGRVQGAVGGMFQNPNDLALNMVAVLPLSVLLALRATRPFGRVMAVLAGFLMIGAVIASQSRSGFLGLAAMFLFLAWQVGRRRPSFLAALAVAVVVVLPFTPSSYWERMASITDGSRDETGSREARRTLLREAYKVFLERPLTGVGAGQFVNYNPGGRAESWRETHNVVLQVASELGIVGLGFFLFLVYRAGFAGRAVRRLLPRAMGQTKQPRWGPPVPPGRSVLTAEDAAFFEAHAATMAAAIAGWFFSALFASVAYHWTFYYLLALTIAPRQILIERLAAAAPRRTPQPGVALQGSQV